MAEKEAIKAKAALEKPVAKKVVAAQIRSLAQRVTRGEGQSVYVLLYRGAALPVPKGRASRVDAGPLFVSNVHAWGQL